MNKKTIIALFLVFSVLVLIGCGKKSDTQSDMKESASSESAQTSQAGDLSSELDDSGQLGDDLNVDDDSGDTDAALSEIQNI